MEREQFTISLWHFFHFSKFSNNPMGVTISKRYSSHSYGSFSITLLLNIFPVTLLTKVTYWHFGISIFKFLKKIAILVNMGPYGTATYSSSSRFSTQLFWMFPVTVITKVICTCWDFEISIFLKKKLNFKSCPMGKWKIAAIIEWLVVQWNLGLGEGSCTCIWGAFDLLVFKIILGSKWPVTRKQLAIERNRVKFRTWR